MKRQGALVLLICLMVSLLMGCDIIDSLGILPTDGSFLLGPEDTQGDADAPVLSTNDRALLSALEGIFPVITQSGQYEHLPAWLQSNYQTQAVAYTLIDLDQDQQKEMVVKTGSQEAAYIVLHHSEEDVFLFAFSAEQMKNLKADGTFISSSGTQVTYTALRFRGGGYVYNDQAKGNYQTGSYAVNGTACDQQAFVKFEKEWAIKEDAVWTQLEVQPPQQEETTAPPATDPPATEPPETTAPETTAPPETVPTPETPVPYLLDIPRADQSVYSEPSYDGQFVRTVGTAGWYTIVEERRDNEGNLWGKLKSGIGWVDLTQIYLEQEWPSLMTANFADKKLLGGGKYHHCVADTSEYAVQVAFRANTVLKNVQLFSTEYLEDAEVSKDLYFLKEMTPDKPLVAELLFGDTTEYKISFEDSEGNLYIYKIYISGRNGSLVFDPS